ncbi:MAG: hypothetical protein CVU48_08010 [Candidatus Cloacimonetes bacterium HGW-Cloacimonetes-1]|nr:MAG: hypothetical protein CVU48_08010 [Candidatus Cloacimonetes bacterium HGW-Cloacimonetes-1]
MFLTLVALLIFGISYIFIITEWVNKMSAALLGGFLVVIFGIMNQETAMSYIDWNVIFLLIGMMMVVSVLKQTGVFQYIAIKTAKLAGGKPFRILLFMFVITGILSALLDNVTTVMMLIPVVLLITNELKVNPVPFVVTMAIASNIGGTATMIGDPPNILIGSSTDYNFNDFIINLAPAVVVIMIFSIGMLYLLYRKGLHVSNESKSRVMEYDVSKLIKNRTLLIRSLIVLTLMMVAFLLQDTLHIESASIAMTAGLVLLIMSNRRKVDQVLMHDIDWITIFFFIGLFMIVGSLQERGLLSMIADKTVDLTHGNIKYTSFAILWLSGILSSIIDNVPFVATMIPVIKSIEIQIGLGKIDALWWSLALGSCLGGNGTLIGASANIVAVGIANKNGCKVSFKQFTQIGILFALMSYLVSTIYLYIRYLH